MGPFSGLTREEVEWRSKALAAGEASDWNGAFASYQRVLQSVRARRAPETEAALIQEFAELLERSGDSPRARKTRNYRRVGFDRA